MTLDRRRLLVSLAAGGAAARILPFADAAPAAAAAAAPAPLTRADGTADWGAVRAEFDGLAPDWTHLTSFLFVSHFRRLRSEIERFRVLLDSDPYWIEAAMYEGVEGEPYEKARNAMAGYLGADADEIAFTSNTTSALAVFYHGLRIRPDQEIVLTEHDHPVHHAVARYAAARSGSPIRYIPLFDSPEGADAGEVVARIGRAIGPKTRVVGVTWVQSSTGVRLPIPAIAEAVALANRGRAEADRCLLLVDGVHGFGNQDADAARLGADFFAAGAHKWFFGPRGTGFLWGRKELWKELRPTIPSFDPRAMDMFELELSNRPLGATRAAWVSPGGFLAYEHFLALPVAAALHAEIGRARIAARIAELNGALRDGLARIPGVMLRTPRAADLAAGINCFEVAGVPVGDVVRRLAEKRIRATASPYAVSYARLAAGILNDERDLEVALAAVRAIARG
jgi:selenocysteine lyase/cysteine desulfurase